MSDNALLWVIAITLFVLVSLTAFAVGHLEDIDHNLSKICYGTNYRLDCR